MRAVSVGALLPPEPWEGRLVGVFRRAVSILASDGAIVSVVGDAGAMEGRALALEAPGFRAFAESAANNLPEGLALCRAGRLEIAGCSVSLDHALVWDSRPRIAAARELLAGGGTGAALGFLDELFRRAIPAEGIFGGGPYGRGFARLSGEQGFPWNALGFGPGTTPAGDDFIAGFLLARALLPNPVAAPALALERTTPAGRSLLLQAAEGCFPEPHAALAEAFARAAVVARATVVARTADGAPAPDGFEDLEAAVADLLTHGASSGSDALGGFLFGAQPEARFRPAVRASGGEGDSRIPARLERTMFRESL